MREEEEQKDFDIEFEYDEQDLKDLKVLDSVEEPVPDREGQRSSFDGLGGRLRGKLKSRGT